MTQDRVHFLDEQRRNRRRSLRVSVFAVLALVSIAALIAVTLAAASVLLIALWYVLQWVAALPRG